MVQRRSNIWGMEKDKQKSADVDLTSSMRVSSNRPRETTNENAHRSHDIV